MPSKTIATNPAQKALEAVRAEMATWVGATVKDTFSCSAKEVMGEITASKLLRRRTYSLVTGTAFATNSPTGTVADGSKFVAGDVLKNVSGVTVGTIQSMAGNTVTLTGNAAVAVATGAAVLGSDGSQVSKCISGKGSDGVGDTPMEVMIGGFAVEADIIGLDSTAKTDLGGVSTVGGIFKF
jgi:hypothetical protein